MKEAIRNIALNFLSDGKVLSRSEITKVVYLTDYFCAKKYGTQCTDITWFFHDHGPFVYDVENAIKDYPGIKKEYKGNMYGNPGWFFSYKGELPEVENPEILDIVNHVKNEINGKGYNAFIDYVYNTSPVIKTRQHTTIDIEKCVKEELDEIFESTWERLTTEYDEAMTALAQ